MSTETPSKAHRYTQSASAPTGQASSHDLPHPSYINSQAYAQNSRFPMDPTVQPTTPPRTPRKASPNTSHIAPGSAVGENSTRQKGRHKNRPKNVNVSPATNRTARRTPPLASAGMPTSAKAVATPTAAAYAGPTFHASPAPSSLPIPSFYSKSVPDSPGIKGMRQSGDLNSSIASEGPIITPLAGNSQKEFRREESPLDLFFKADREEKARARSASSSQHAVTATGPFQPPLSPHNSQTPPATSSLSSQRYSHANRSSGSGLFALELDGPSTPGTPFGPAFSTPYSERINAARASRQLPKVADESTQPGESLERSEQLKAYLFSGITPQPTIPSTTQTPHGSHSYPNFPHESRTPAQSLRTNGRSSGLRKEVTPTKTPTRTPDRYDSQNQSSASFLSNKQNSSCATQLNAKSVSQTAPAVSSFGSPSGDRTADIRGMEDSLRKILKLDSGMIGSHTSNTAVVSVPNYVGGRPPPMNGMHNGVMRS